MLGQCGVIGAGNPAHEQVRVKRRRRYRRDDIAVVDIHHHAGGTFLAQAGLHEILHIGVNGQPQVFALQTFLAVQLAHHPADGVDLDPLGASRAAQGVFHPLLDPDLADLEACGIISSGSTLSAAFLLRQLAQVFFRNRADIADHMRKIYIARIDAAEAQPRASHRAGQGR